MTTVWIIGRLDSPEAASLPMHVIEAFPGASVRHFDSPCDAAENVSESPDVVLVVQLRPREFSPSEIADLLASQPLSQFLVGLGGWCASSARSEAAWPEAIAVPLWEVPERLRRISISERQGVACPPWLTSGRDEVVLSPPGRSTPWLTRPVLVESPDRNFAETLRSLVADAQLHRGQDVVTDRPILLWDADPLEVRLPQLAFLDRSRHGPLIALTALPIPDNVARLRRAGADLVLAKPFLLAELYETLESVQAVTC